MALLTFGCVSVAVLSTMDNYRLFKPSNLLHTQEQMNRYRHGGFHPVSLGDTFKAGR